MKYILFYDPTDEHGFASNFYTTKPLKINGETWRNTEQYFQAMKFRGESASPINIEYSNLIKKADKPMKAKMLGTQKPNNRFGKKWKLNKKNDPQLVNDLIKKYKNQVHLRPDWNKARLHVMIKALLHKFKDPVLRNKLVSIPDNALMVEHTTRDNIWGDGGDGGTEEKGSNYLGKILTVLSHVLKYGNCDKMSSALRKKVKIKDKKKKKSQLKILSWNVNGIRSRVVSHQKYKKCQILSEIEPESNLGVMVVKHNPDIICLQETRCDEKISGCIQIDGYYQYWSCSQGSGARSGARYSGVTLWTKTEPKNVTYSIPTLPEHEGRIIVAEFNSFVLLTTYVPNAGTNFDYRVNMWDPAIHRFLQNLKKKNKKVIWCGDLNVARTPNDVFWGNPESSSYNKAALKGVGRAAKAGYTKEEREGIEHILKGGYIDVYRHFYPKEKEAYTWWNPRIPIFRTKNKGWRLDYFIVSKNLIPCVQDMVILRDAGLLTKPQGSDHAAILLTIDKQCLY